MTDEALRALEREVEAGGTPASRLRLAHALARAGRDGEVASALAPTRGDAEVRRALHARPAWESEAGPGDTGVLDVAPVTEPRVLWRRRPKIKDEPGGLLATGFTVLARSGSSSVRPRGAFAGRGTIDGDDDFVGGSVVALDSETGEERWRPGVRVQIPPVAVGDVVVVPHPTSLRGHDAWTGARRWDLPGITGVTALARGGGAGLVVATANGVVRWLQTDAPGPPVDAWRTQVDRGRDGSVRGIACAGGLVAVWLRTALIVRGEGAGSHQDWSLVLDADSGAPRFELEGRALAIDAQGGVLRLDSGGLATFGLDGVVRPAHDGQLLALAPTSLFLATDQGVVRTERGSQRVSALLLPPGGRLESGHAALPSTGAVVAQGALYVIGLEPTGVSWTVRALAPEDGRELWRHDLSSPGLSLPRLAAAPGRLYVLSDRGAVQALGT